jgi:hypothetical protein
LEPLRPDNTWCPEAAVKKEQQNNYYDDLLNENTERALRGLPPTEEYKRLDSLTDKFMTQIEAESTLNGDGTLDDEEAAIAVEVLEFLGAFERLLGPELLELALVN